MKDNQVSLHRVIKASPEKVYRAFTDSLAIAAWLPPYGFLCTVHEMDVKVGGTFRMSFQNFTTGHSHSFGGEYVAVEPNQFLKYTDRFDDPHLPGEMPTTIWLEKTSVGTELKVLQENIPAAIPAEMCYLGWQESLDKLIKLVEPNIPDAG
ncbi:SRPBCC family protein [Mucilaginibacter segetis]|uniref:SRPBCC family protein n=1 Tax=Mucilaginibacter segetis TaxID=2793071 RepID=A0A934UMY5_9SPHI|nr:SRPBCC family protein [Mucilaginibacter segetis]MBK0379356.1 SRPBCC family protein [Mucilaginibacter segetis]